MLVAIVEALSDAHHSSRERSDAIPQLHEHDVLIWAVCAAGIAGVLVRPRGFGEWVWATASSVALVLFGLLGPRDVLQAIGAGTDVYAFLTGMMLLAELARREGVFTWLAAHAVAAARGSRYRLFALVYAVGVVVTVVLSNDATAVVLTPAVAAAVRRANVAPLPHLFACALVANAASFVLPISNPANLVVFAGRMPALTAWLATFALPSALAVVATFAALAFASRADLRGTVAGVVGTVELATGGRIVLAGIALTAAALLAASAVGAPLGATALACGALLLALACLRDRASFGTIARGVSWSVLPLVASLFVMVRAVETTGLLDVTRRAVGALATFGSPVDGIVAAFAAAALANVTNNLPAGLFAGASVATLPVHDSLRSAVAIGIDLGPNLSVTGSLATVLWLAALRREGIDVSSRRFLRLGVLVMPPALLLAAGSAALFR